VADKTHIRGDHHVISKSDISRVSREIVRLKEKIFSSPVKGVVLPQELSMLISVSMEQTMQKISHSKAIKGYHLTFLLKDFPQACTHIIHILVAQFRLERQCDQIVIIVIRIWEILYLPSQCIYAVIIRRGLKWTLVATPRSAIFR
jgi:hypothetical protein